MLKFICSLVALMMPLAVCAADYDPAAPSKGVKAVTEAAKETVLSAPVKTPPANTKPLLSKNPPLSDKDKFKLYDADKSQKLSYREFVRYSGRAKLQHIGLQNRFIRLDKDLDRKLSQQELKNWGK